MLADLRRCGQETTAGGTTRPAIDDSKRAAKSATRLAEDIWLRTNLRTMARLARDRTFNGSSGWNRFAASFRRSFGSSGRTVVATGDSSCSRWRWSPGNCLEIFHLLARVLHQLIELHLRSGGFNRFNQL